MCQKYNKKPISIPQSVQEKVSLGKLLGTVPINVVCGKTVDISYKEVYSEMSRKIL